MTIDHTPWGLDSAVPDVPIEHTDYPTSEALDSTDYNPVTGELTISFSDGDEITLDGVPREVVAQLRSAPSAGAFFNLFMRGRY